ncbi:hypothetical protein RHGRI_037871 [Rhododendron griersonianum]|uniref:Bifunctional inhibitor/plant lipid transfer protein/seed storage helical domain-containing protein n=1 Tax=Rhododendron griersonianum TaxID=479676 RepID=A0AAV6HU16_9ERIC|nr:hypothetical protein RHGRI_037871 [Rhododendron griersonianum]
MGTTRATAILVATAALLVTVAAAQAPAPETLTTAAGAPGPSAGMDCVTYLVNMSDCLTYVEEGSNLTAPDKSCCPELAGLVDSHPVCLCQLLGTNTSASLGVQINFQKALKLPSVCGVKTPPMSTCSAAGYPVGVPTAAGYPVGVPTPSEAPSPPGSTSPGASTSKSGASGIANVSQLLGFAIACLTTALVF